MTHASVCVKPTEVLHALDTSIKKARSNYSGLITVLWPTNTTAVFMRRQYEKTKKAGCVGVRFSSVSEANSILEDAQAEVSLNTSLNSITNFDTFVSIAKEIFPSSAPLVKVPLIRNTINLLYSMENEYQEQAINDYEYVRKCFDFFSKKEVRNDSLEIRALNAEQILGKCIVVGYEALNHSTKKFIKRYKNIIHQEIIEKSNKLNEEVEIYENSYEEVNAVLENLLENLSSTESMTVDSTAIIVPTNAYKQLVISVARRKGIPLSGSSPQTISSHPFIELASYLLKNSQEHISFELIQSFIEKFPWIKHAGKKHPVINCLFKINNARSIDQYFLVIIDFIATNIDTDFFLESDFHSVATKDQSQLAMSVLDDLAQSKSVLDTSEASLLLNQHCNSQPLRLGAMGHGLYIALPTEIWGSSFRKVYICSINDSYIKPSALPSSFIPKDQYERYELNSKNEKETESLNILSWLRSCSESIFMSSSKYDYEGKAIPLPYWAQIIEPSVQYDPLADFDWSNISDAVIQLEKIISNSLNNVNSLCKLPSEKAISATAIEDFAKCPSMFFHKRILSAKKPLQRDDPDDLHPIIRGILAHDLLEEYINNSLSKESVVQLLYTKINKMVEDKILPNNASSQLVIEKLALVVDNFIELHKMSNAVDVKAEVAVINTIQDSDNAISIKGKIDRVHTDINNNKTIVDYKTGKLKKSTNEFRLGRKIQLALYALLMEDEVHKLEYWHLLESKDKVETIEWNEEKIKDAKEILFAIKRFLDKGIFLPREHYVEIKSKSISYESDCNYCDNEPYCLQEQKLLWPSLKSSTEIKEYSNITGENLIKDQGTSDEH